MKIENIQVYHVSMPLKEPWKTAFSVEHAIDSILVGMTCDGVTGWGEAAPYSLPQYSPEWAAGAFQLICDALAPQLLGQQIEDGDALQGALARFKGNFFAKASLDLAWWDLHAKLSDQPLWQAVGGEGDTIRLGADISVMDDLDAFLARIGAAREFGFPRTKLKFRRDWGVEMVRKVREAFPDLVMHVDCNSSFTLDDTAMFRELGQFNLAMIEQPLGYDDLVDHARLQEKIKTPICLDESLTSVDKVRNAIEIGACRWVNLKAGRIGGLTNAIAAHDYCDAQGVPCWVGGMLESSVGQGASMALATLSNIAYPCDIFPTERLYARDLGTPEIHVTGPDMTLPAVSGHGFVPESGMLAACTVNERLLSAVA